MKKIYRNRQSQNQVLYSGITELGDLDAGFPGYNRDLIRQFAKGFHLNQNKKINHLVLDFGAGSGTLAEIWKLELGFYPTCVEIDPKLIGILRTKGIDTYSEVNRLHEKFSLVYSSNVLEHIEDDVEALNTIKQVMTPGGYLGIYVPALPCLFSNLDRNVGHFRRYRRRELIQKVEKAGFQVESCYYNDSIGVLASLAIRIFGYKNNMKLGSMGSIIFYDRWIYPISRILDKIVFRNLIGKNLFLFAINLTKP